MVGCGSKKIGTLDRRADAASLSEARAAGSDGAAGEGHDAEAAPGGLFIDVDLGDDWAPFIFSETDAPGWPVKPNAYRRTFIELANDRLRPDGGERAPGDPSDHNYLEVFGIPPTLSVLLARIDDDLLRDCHRNLDLDGLRQWTGNLGFLDREHARKDHTEALADAQWLQERIELAAAAVTDAGGGAASAPPVTAETVARDLRLRARVERTSVGQARLRAVRTAQARLVCEGLLSPTSRFVEGMYDLPTHEAVAAWERKNDIFGWGFLGGETVASLLRPPLELHFETFQRILRERVADAAGIVEDGSITRGGGGAAPPTFRDEAGAVRPVPNLVEDMTQALMRALRVTAPNEMIALLRSHGRAGLSELRVAFQRPALPPYYGPDMDLHVEIDRGDVWYDLPLDVAGKPKEQRRERFPRFTLAVSWNGQRIPLVRWRTTIGSWRTEAGIDGRLYMKYKSSDVGRRVWKNIVAGPVWIPPDGTPTRDLLTRKVLDRNVGAETVVNTDVMGPGFQSAYGLVMAIHLEQKRGGRTFDNQIRTHGSVDYTSIARRYSHGCHRLVNNRAVRLFDFVLRHRSFTRMGNVPLRMKRTFVHEGTAYAYDLDTRGYYYELARPLPVEVLEGRIMGDVKRPITAYVRKPGVDYSRPAVGEPDPDLAPPVSVSPPEPEPATAVTPEP